MEVFSDLYWSDDVGKSEIQTGTSYWRKNVWRGRDNSGTGPRQAPACRNLKCGLRSVQWTVTLNDRMDKIYFKSKLNFYFTISYNLKDTNTKFPSKYMDYYQCVEI